jgi:hypothetical protein
MNICPKSFSAGMEFCKIDPWLVLFCRYAYARPVMATTSRLEPVLQKIEKKCYKSMHRIICM